MKLESTLSSVVLPAPVPPLISPFSRARTQCDRKSSIGRVSARSVTRSSALSRSAGNRRIDSSGPSTASGGMIALTREPSGSRASTIGELSSTRRPTALTMRSMTRRRWRSSWKVGGDLLELAVALDEHVLVGVDQDVADRRVAQQRLQRAEPEHVIEQLDEERFALAEAERRSLLGEQLGEQRANLAFGARAVRLRERLEVEAVEQLAVHARLEIEVLRCRGGCGRAATGGGDGGDSVHGWLPDRGDAGGQTIRARAGGGAPAPARASPRRARESAA